MAMAVIWHETCPEWWCSSLWTSTLMHSAPLGQNLIATCAATLPHEHLDQADKACAGQIIHAKGGSTGSPVRCVHCSTSTSCKESTFSLVCLSTASMTTPYDPWPRVRIFWYRGCPYMGSSPLVLLLNIDLKRSLVAMAQDASCTALYHSAMDYTRRARTVFRAPSPAQ